MFTFYHSSVIITPWNKQYPQFNAGNWTLEKLANVPKDSAGAYQTQTQADSKAHAGTELPHSSIITYLFYHTPQ